MIIRSTLYKLFSSFAFGNTEDKKEDDGTMGYTPCFGKATEVKRISVSAKHTGILLDAIESTATITYKFILQVIDNDTQNPCLYVTSEAKVYNFANIDESKVPVDALPLLASMKAFMKAHAEEDPEQFFLCVFKKDERINMGASTAFGDITVFEEQAVALARKTLMEEYFPGTDTAHLLK